MHQKKVLLLIQASVDGLVFSLFRLDLVGLGFRENWFQDNFILLILLKLWYRDIGRNYNSIGRRAKEKDNHLNTTLLSHWLTYY